MSETHNPYAEVVRTLTTQFDSSVSAESLAMLVYVGLDTGTKRALAHGDPQIATAITSLRAVIEFIAYAKDADLSDLRKTVRVGLERWIEAPGLTVPVPVESP